MRIFTKVTPIFFSALIALVSSMAFAQETSAPGTPVPLQTKMDANLKNVLDVIASAIVGRFPGVSKDSKVEINVNSALDQGKADGTFNITVNGADAQPVINTDGQIVAGMTRTSDGGVAVDMQTSGRLSSQQLLQVLDGTSQSLDGAAVLTAEQQALPASQKSALIFENLKQNILASLDKAGESAAPGKKTQTFGSSNSMVATDPNAAPALAPAIVAELREVVQNAFVVSSADGQTVFAVNMDVVKALSSEVAKVNPVLAVLASFESIEMKVGDIDASFTLTSHSEVSNQLVSIYDQYLVQEQTKEGGLKSLSELMSKIGVWAVGRCSTEKYQGLCVDKLLNGCAENIRHVSTCIEQARAIQDARDSGNIVGNGAVMFGNEVSQAFGDSVDATGKAIDNTGVAIGNFWNYVTGSN